MLPAVHTHLNGTSVDLFFLFTPLMLNPELSLTRGSLGEDKC